MNWIILFLAGLFEVSLTFCLGKTREASGIDWDIRFQRAGHSHTAFLPVHAHCLLDWIESCVILKDEI